MGSHTTTGTLPCTAEERSRPRGLRIGDALLAEISELCCPVSAASQENCVSLGCEQCLPEVLTFFYDWNFNNNYTLVGFFFVFQTHLSILLVFSVFSSFESFLMDRYVPSLPKGGCHFHVTSPVCVHLFCISAFHRRHPC